MKTSAGTWAAVRFEIRAGRSQARIVASQIQKTLEEFHHHEEEPERTGTGDYRQFAARDEQTVIGFIELGRRSENGRDSRGDLLALFHGIAAGQYEAVGNRIGVNEKVGFVVHQRGFDVSFADLAKKNSDDPGSAPKGGELGEFSRGMMVKPFEDTVFAMNPGDISAVVESDFGFHIIQLERVVPPSAKP